MLQGKSYICRELRKYVYTTYVGSRAYVDADHRGCRQKVGNKPTRRELCPGLVGEQVTQRGANVGCIRVGQGDDGVNPFLHVS